METENCEVNQNKVLTRMFVRDMLDTLKRDHNIKKKTTINEQAFKDSVTFTSIIFGTVKKKEKEKKEKLKKGREAERIKYFLFI